ncbi:MAG TPA: hypothetical protein VJ836_02535 [Candidatus Saccharimonadales bacterium]|nr:hypothetical protein [Candidatus Saccharimonadales bacterium]
MPASESFNFEITPLLQQDLDNDNLDLTFNPAALTSWAETAGAVLPSETTVQACAGIEMFRTHSQRRNAVHAGGIANEMCFAPFLAVPQFL